MENGHIGPLHFPAVNGIAEMTLGVGLILLLLARSAGAMGSWEPQFVVRLRAGPAPQQLDPNATDDLAAEPDATAVQSKSHDGA